MYQFEGQLIYRRPLVVIHTPSKLEATGSHQQGFPHFSDLLCVTLIDEEHSRFNLFIGRLRSTGLPPSSDTSEGTDVRATLHPVLPGHNLILHKLVSKLD